MMSSTQSNSNLYHAPPLLYLATGACQPCRKKHLGCNHARPCQRCKSAKREAECFDVPTTHQAKKWQFHQWQSQSQSRQYQNPTATAAPAPAGSFDPVSFDEIPLYGSSYTPSITHESPLVLEPSLIDHLPPRPPVSIPSMRIPSQKPVITLIMGTDMRIARASVSKDQGKQKTHSRRRG